MLGKTFQTLLCKFLVRHQDEFIFFSSNKGEGVGASKTCTDFNKSGLRFTVVEGLNNYPELREFVLLCVKDYLCRHEVDRNQFAKEIYEKD